MRSQGPCPAACLHEIRSSHPPSLPTGASAGKRSLSWLPPSGAKTYGVSSAGAAVDRQAAAPRLSAAAREADLAEQVAADVAGRAGRYAVSVRAGLARTARGAAAQRARTVAAAARRADAVGARLSGRASVSACAAVLRIDLRERAGHQHPAPAGPRREAQEILARRNADAGAGAPDLFAQLTGRAAEDALPALACLRRAVVAAAAAVRGVVLEVRTRAGGAVRAGGLAVPAGHAAVGEERRGIARERVLAPARRPAAASEAGLSPGAGVAASPAVLRVAVDEEVPHPHRPGGPRQGRALAVRRHPRPQPDK